MGGYNTQAIRHWLENNIDAKWIQAERFFHVHGSDPLDADTLGELAACGASVKIGEAGDVFVIGPGDEEPPEDFREADEVASTAAGFPKPEAHARQVRENAEGGGYGVTLDTLADARADARTSKYNLRGAASNLDIAADDLGLLPDEIRGRIRHNQRELRAIARWVDGFEDGVADEINVLKADK